jgi:hypothetical protein
MKKSELKKIIKEEIKKVLNENYQVGQTITTPFSDLGPATIVDISSYEDNQEEIDASIEDSGWESDASREELTWYKLEFEDGHSEWVDSDEINSFN